jgi:ABC-type phosphate transport system permease subunit
MIRALLLLLISAGCAFGQTAPKVHALGLYNETTSLSLSAFPSDDKLAIRLFSFYSDVEHTKQVQLKTGSAVLLTCTTAICNFDWPKADMLARKCVQCPITVLVTDKLNKQYRIDTTVLRP